MQTKTARRTDGETKEPSAGNIKSKIISFRVSDEEYKTVEAASQKQGFPSVSLFARFTTLSSHLSETFKSPLDTDFNRLWRRLDALTDTLERLAARAGVVLAPSNPG